MYRKGKEYSAIADLQISEGALHPLSREKDSLVKEKAMKQIVKMATLTSRTATIITFTPCTPGAFILQLR